MNAKWVLQFGAGAFAAVCGADGVCADAGRPAGVAEIILPPGEFTAMSAPLDGVGDGWLHGVDEAFVWDAERQAWQRIAKTATGGWVAEGGGSVAEKAGTALVVYNGSRQPGTVRITGSAPMEKQRAVELEEGLTLLGNPFGAAEKQTPFATEWARAEEAEGSAKIFVRPAIPGLDAAGGALACLTPAGVGANGDVWFAAPPAPEGTPPLLVFSRETRVKDGVAVPGAWVARALIPAGGAGYRHHAPAAGAEGSLTLVAAADLRDGNRNGVPDAMEALLLGRVAEPPSMTDGMPGAGTPVDDAALAGLRELLLELLNAPGAAATSGLPPMAFQVNDGQERTLRAHVERGRVLRRLGLSLDRELTFAQAVALEREEQKMEAVR